MYLTACVCTSVCHICAGAETRRPEKSSEPLNLELQAVVSHQTQVLGAELGAISPAHNYYLAPLSIVLFLCFVDRACVTVFTSVTSSPL